MKIGVIK